MKTIKEVIEDKLSEILQNGTLFANHTEEPVDINLIELEILSYDLGIRMYDLDQDDLWDIIEQWADENNVNVES